MLLNVEARTMMGATGMIAIAMLLAGCGGGSDIEFAATLAPQNAPVTEQYTPNDVTPPPPGPSRYDAVGYATVMAGGELGQIPQISATHAGLPVGSFVELTGLDSGKTIIVIIADGPPPRDGWLLTLSPGAAQLLNAGSSTMIAVRVRRLDPPGLDQSALREGRAASERIDAPPVLLRALRKRLPSSPRDASPASAVSKPRPARVAPGAPYPVPGRAAAIAAPATTGTGLFVQIAALSSPERATALAQSLGASVQANGGIYRVRLGPYADQVSADRARADIANRGYADARIVRD
ncbi:SPOR domain-containing protein [Sphingomonas sp. 28-62-11]|uniref:SPOR domain-containing protein n=1 Tax=Sphingomonas sp. 28-62-11 TaxID=1970432 RepID=UPI000BC4A695|nr:MAG: hypothetical protein B7Y49_01015 [Sphingomonas sp. 28-62-11]